MPVFSKKRNLRALEDRKADLSHMFEMLSEELIETEKKVENISYQIEFFGATPELIKDRTDCEIMLSWIQSQFDEIKKSLFKVDSQTLIH